jgi:hypothetical protein
LNVEIVEGTLQKGSGTVRAKAGAHPGHTEFRIWLLISAGCTTVFGIMHHVDHVIRGNHSGWPFEQAVTPFTFSLLIYALLLPGLYLTAKGRLMARYWLFTAVVGLALVVWVHFIPRGDYEAPIEDIYAVYGSPLAGLFALLVLAGLVTSLAVLAIAAIQALRFMRR